MGSGSIAGFGHSMICEAQPGTYQSGRWTTAGLPLAARSRASITVIGSIKACAAHPGPGQRVLYTLTGAPGLLGWLIIAGSVAAALIQGFAQDLLLNTMFASLLAQENGVSSRRASTDDGTAGEDDAAAIQLHPDELLARRGPSGSAPWPGCAKRWGASPANC